ncbi:23S rRNA (uracil(1939)-C(5))-methyltransferase RlmD [Chakrabartyella piscis]|uniref:23S rRNA (uracil(1939)-C(5))-methyltransferase RlmD n=1 Tax=Chakrabartyella piscis TaxID=2918914 RepID=UPI0029585F28|nr:23S rRNA (uracil(1939)-C(5))-methyltransferase RlmD [Chakrabartyella piscis]
MNLPIEKNGIYEMRIDGMGSNGEGIGRIDGYAVFVDGALPEELVKVLILKTRKSFGFGKLLEVLEPSPERVEPVCPVARQCGGCQLQHLSYKGQLAYKEDKVNEDIARIGGLQGVKSLPIIGVEHPYRYRNKAQFPVGCNKDGQVQIGFYAKRSHRIIDTPVCMLQNEINDNIIQLVKEFLEEFKITTYNEITHKGLVRHILTRIGKHSGEIMVCIVINGKKLPKCEILVERLQQVEGVVSVVLNENHEDTNVILGQKCTTLWGKDTITDTLGGIEFEISPLSFYQVNPLQTEVLYRRALEMANLKGDERVFDLYCGIGTISLFFAQHVKEVFGVEIVEEAIVDAEKNAERNGIGNATFEAGAAEEVIPRLYREKGITADVVVVDPPRKGCDQQLLDVLGQIKPEKIVYISCNPATLARDMKILTEMGFVAEEVQAVDMFPNTIHVEAITMMTYCGKTPKNDG